MTLEITGVIPNVDAEMLGVNYELRDENKIIIDSGTVDVSADGSYTIPMGGKGVALDDKYLRMIDNFNGSNFDTFGHSYDGVTVTDDGIIIDLPDLVSIIGFGDSITEIGTSLSTAGDNLRPADGSISTYVRGYTTAMMLFSCNSDYIVLDPQGHSGYTTAQLLSFGKVADILATTADVIVMKAGANDVAAQRPDLDIQADYVDIVTQLVDGGKKVFIVPATHMNRVVDLGTENGQIDTLNAFLQTHADATVDVAIAPVNTVFNAGVASDPPGVLGSNYAGWTSDGIHPTNKGGVQEGNFNAPYLDTAYPSTNDTKDTNNLIPQFSGETGSVPYNNGTAPDGWKGFGALSWEADVDLGDGIPWWKVTTNGAGTSNSSNKATMTLEVIPDYLLDGYYVPEFTVKIVTPGAMSKLRLTVESNSVAYGTSEFTAFTPNVDGAYTAGVYKVRAMPTRLGTEGVSSFVLDTAQGLGDNAVFYVSSPMFYKVIDA